ncbi:hypothetical protein [Streptomyces sp. NPDC059874]|uniref:hypothetical protein n=1 Tax=Streptomyces sp. NPDC059874 TaxID=3346983 RepID=UPI003652F54D
MRRVLATALLTLLASAAGTVTATAQGEHFIGDIVCTTSLTSGLQCSGKAAGLGNRPSQAFLAADSVVAEYACKNPAGNVAPGQRTRFNRVTGPSQTIQPSSGQITFTNVTLAIPSTPPAQRVCPNRNWTATLVKVTYEDVVLTIEQRGTDPLTAELGTIVIPPETTLRF